MNNKIIDINKKSYISIVIMLGVLIVLSIALTFIIPNGTFGTKIDEFGNEVIDFNNYIRLEDVGGINILKGLFSPILLLFSSDGLSIIMLCLFLLVIAGAFQVMADTSGMSVIVNRLIKKFYDRKRLLIAFIVLIFMIFGSFFGLFEEVLTLLPLVVMITISLGYDGYLGFLICIVATGFGFASAITNPFTVITASNIIGASPMSNVWYRFIIFFVMYGLLLLYVFHHMRIVSKKPEISPTYNEDLKKKDIVPNILSNENESRIFKTYVTFLVFVLASIITVTSISALRSYTVVFLIAIFLIGGIIAGYLSSGDIKKTLISFKNGIIATAPTILLVLMASSIKYILEEGMVIATISNYISLLVEGKDKIVVAIYIYIIILVLEFFISSSTAKAIFVMGILSLVNIELSKELMVLIYLFGDGYTNVLLPTSPVLLIALSMIGMNYFSWVKKSKYLFLINFAIVIILIIIAVLIGY